MTQEQINEYSIVMAEFNCYDINGFMEKPQFMKYFSSYDWLMPVWIKFNDLGFDENVYLNDTYQWFISRVGKSILNDPIKTAFEEMYKAIEWYNKMSLC
jgi:hypothetical protein